MNIEYLEKLVKDLSVSEYTQPCKTSPSGGMSEKYYKALEDLALARKLARETYKPKEKPIVNKKERIITSTTHERWERRIFKQVDRMFSHR